MVRQQSQTGLSLSGGITEEKLLVKIYIFLILQVMIVEELKDVDSKIMYNCSTWQSRSITTLP